MYAKIASESLTCIADMQYFDYFKSSFDSLSEYLLRKYGKAGTDSEESFRKKIKEKKKPYLSGIDKVKIIIKTYKMRLRKPFMMQHYFPTW